MKRVEATGHGLRWNLLESEVAQLRDLVVQLDEALDGPLDDPVVERLFPAAVEDDEELDAELRALHAGDLLLERHTAAAAFLTLLDTSTPRRRGVVQVQLTDDQPDLVLGVLNDLRLALGARVGFDVVAARDDEESEDETVLAFLDTMDWLAGHQSLLLEHLA